MTEHPAARDLKVFIPARDFDRSLAWYTALGWHCNWRHGDGLAEIELAGHRLYLQNFYAREWAENTMIYVDVDSADDWYRHVRRTLDDEGFDACRVAHPRDEDYGARVTFAWDPSGVLVHFAERR